MHTRTALGIAAAPAAPGTARREGAHCPGQVVRLVPVVEALAVAFGHLGPHRYIGPTHRAAAVSRSGPANVAVVDREADLQRHLIMLNLALVEMTAGLDDLEP